MRCLTDHQLLLITNHRFGTNLPLPYHPQQKSPLKKMMLGWMIVLLVCIGYFLNEARHAPIIEEEASDEASEAPPDDSDANHPDSRARSLPKPPRDSLDQ